MVNRRLPRTILPPGQIYHEATATLKSMAIDRGPLWRDQADHWGNLDNRFEPIRDSDNGKFLGSWVWILTPVTTAQDCPPQIIAY